MPPDSPEQNLKITQISEKMGKFLKFSDKNSLISHFRTKIEQFQKQSPLPMKNLDVVLLNAKDETSKNRWAAFFTLRFLIQMIYLLNLESENNEEHISFYSELQTHLDKSPDLYMDNDQFSSSIHQIIKDWIEQLNQHTLSSLDDQNWVNLAYPDFSHFIEIVQLLKKWDVTAFSAYEMGNLYQQFLQQLHMQKVMGAFYTPEKTVCYMLSKIELNNRSLILDPACGSGHFLEMTLERLVSYYQDKDLREVEAIQQASNQIWGIDLDPLALMLAHLRFQMYHSSMINEIQTHLICTDALLIPFHQRVDSSLFSNNYVSTDLFCQFLLEKTSSLPKQFDVIIGNPPYGLVRDTKRKRQYQDLYRKFDSVYNYPLGSNDVIGFFLANAIKKVKNGGKICFLISDSFLSLKSHYPLRRLILDTCKIDEILLAPINLFRPQTTSRTCILTLTKQICLKGYNRPLNKRRPDKSICRCLSCQKRWNHVIRFVGRLESESQYLKIPSSKINRIVQSLYNKVEFNPFWYFVPKKIIDVMEEVKIRQEIQKKEERIIKIREKFRNIASSTKSLNVKSLQQKILVLEKELSYLSSVLAKIKDSKEKFIFCPLGLHIEGGAGLQTGANSQHLKIIRDSSLWKRLATKKSRKLQLYEICNSETIVDPEFIRLLNPNELKNLQQNGFTQKRTLVPFKRNKKKERYINSEEWYIDWSSDSVQQIKRLAKESGGRSAVFRNPHLYFRRGIITNAHHGILSCCLIEQAIHAVNTNLFYGTDISTKFLLGYLNSNLISFILGKVINTSFGGMSGHATPSDIKRLPLIMPLSKDQQQYETFKKKIIDLVDKILWKLTKDPDADISIEEQTINHQIYQVFKLDDLAINQIEKYIKKMQNQKQFY